MQGDDILVVNLALREHEFKMNLLHIILSVAHGCVASGCCGHSAPTMTHGVLPFK